MRNPLITEAGRYASQLLPLKSDIYRNGGSSYSNFKILLLSKEMSIPKVRCRSSGVLPEIQAFWYVTQENLAFDLHIFRYDLNSVEVLPNFPSSICFVKIHRPQRGVFNSKIQHCLLVATETDIVVYGIEADTHSIINTDFSAKLRSRPTCIESGGGSIFLGCADGNVYCACCRSVDFLNYKYLSLYSPGASLLGSISSIFSRKKDGVSCISVGRRYLVSLSRGIEVYSIEHGIYKAYEIKPGVPVSYVGVQVVEESPVLFYCVQPSGVRDFYSTEYLFSKDPAVVESSDMARMTHSTPTKFLSTRTGAERSTLVLHTFNEDQNRNFSRSRAVENFEIVTVYSQVLSVELGDSDLYIHTPGSIIHYTILDSKRLLLNSRTQEVYQMYRNYGDIEFMVRYFQLLTENEDVSKLEGLCKSDSIRSHALFVWIYTLVRPVWQIDLGQLKASDDAPANEAVLDEIIRKLRILRQRIAFGYGAAREFIDEFVQTNFYVSLLLDYGVPFKETFESILTQESGFKTLSLKGLLDAFAGGQSIEPLLKTMQNGCPMYLPLESINLQRGLQLVRKDDRESLLRSLGYLSQARFDPGVVHKFNELGFFYGSVFLIREKFDFDYETAVSLLAESVRCKRALECGAEDAREAFLYPFFEAVLRLDAFSPCVCCDSTPGSVDLLAIRNPLFGVFLKDQVHKNERAHGLYWKYLLARNEKDEAVQALVSLSQRADLPLARKVDFLQTALSISTGTRMHSEIRLRLKLYEIQSELVSRVPSLRTSALLDSDTLYNDYCQGHSDLKIKILDAINFRNEKVVRGLFEAYFRDLSLRECFLFLGELSNKRLGLVFDILVEKLRPSTVDFCSGLAAAGFEYDEIVGLVRDALGSSVHPEAKVELLKSLKLFSKFGEYKECERLCERDFGIRVYK